jgi:hypothetical protein
MTILDDIVAWRRVAIGARLDLDIDDDGLANGAWAHVTFVETPDDFGTPVEGVYTLEDNRTYIVTTTVDLAGGRLVGGQNTTIRGWSSENCRIKSTGLGETALITSVYTLPMLNITIEANLALDLDAVADQALDWNGVNFTDCASVGRIAGYNNVIWVNCGVLNSANLTFDGTIGTVGFDGCIFVGIAGQSTIILPATYTATRRFRIIYSAIVAFGGATGIQVDPAATIPVESFILDTVALSGGATYVSGIDQTDTRSLWVNNTGVINTATTGVMTMQGNATATVVSATNVEYKAEGITTLDTSVSQKFSMPVNNRLQYDGAINRQFRCTAMLTVTSGNNVQVGVYFGKNGTPIVNSEMYATTDGNGRFENMAVQTVVELTQGDYMEVFVENATNTTDITLADLSAIVEALN